VPLCGREEQAVQPLARELAVVLIQPVFDVVRVLCWFFRPELVAVAVSLAAMLCTGDAYVAAGQRRTRLASSSSLSGLRHHSIL
jgi:hypothetical protein